MKSWKKYTVVAITAMSFMTTPLPVAEAANAVDAIVAGAAAMVYVKTELKKKDEHGQAESLEQTMKKTGYYDDEAMQARADRIVAELQKSKLVKRKYEVYVNPDEDFNAFMTWGAVMSINKGAMDRLDDNELAYIVAHEIAHGENRDIIKGIEKTVGLSTAISIYNSKGSLLTNLLGNYMHNQVFTMKQEKRADELGFQILADSSYNIGGAAAGMWVLYNELGDHYREGLAQAIAPNNHPKTSERVKLNSKRLTDYSGGHVTVAASTVYINGKEIYNVPDAGRYKGTERAFLMAGKLARLYHHGKMDSAYASGSDVYVGSERIVGAGDHGTASEIANHINSAKGKAKLTEAEAEKIREAKEKEQKKQSQGNVLNKKKAESAEKKEDPVNKGEKKNDAKKVEENKQKGRLLKIKRTEE